MDTTVTEAVRLSNELHIVVEQVTDLYTMWITMGIFNFVFYCYNTIGLVVLVYILLPKLIPEFKCDKMLIFIPFFRIFIYLSIYAHLNPTKALKYRFILGILSILGLFIPLLFIGVIFINTYFLNKTLKYYFVQKDFITINTVFLGLFTTPLILNEWRYRNVRYRELP